MASYVLDTNSLTLLKYKQPRLLEAVKRHDGDVIAVTSVSVDEYLTGWYAKYRRVRTFQQKAIASTGLVEAIVVLRQFHIWPETENSLLQADRLVKSKLNIGKMDIRIATIALELDATVVTSNIRDFSRVPGAEGGGLVGVAHLCGRTRWCGRVVTVLRYDPDAMTEHRHCKTGSSRVQHDHNFLVDDPGCRPIIKL